MHPDKAQALSCYLCKLAGGSREKKITSFKGHKTCIDVCTSTHFYLEFLMIRDVDK